MHTELPIFADSVAAFATFLMDSEHSVCILNSNLSEMHTIQSKMKDLVASRATVFLISTSLVAGKRYIAYSLTL